jgi:hypothetical protein
MDTNEIIEVCIDNANSEGVEHTVALCRGQTVLS